MLTAARPADAEFPRAIKIDGIDYDVIVYVVLVNMSTDDKGVVALRQLHGKLAPDFICQLRRDLTGLEGLPQVVGDHVVAAPPARFRLLRILYIVDHVGYRGRYRPALADMQRH